MTIQIDRRIVYFFLLLCKTIETLGKLFVNVSKIEIKGRLVFQSSGYVKRRGGGKNDD